MPTSERLLLWHEFQGNAAGIDRCTFITGPQELMQESGRLGFWGSAPQCGQPRAAHYAAEPAAPEPVESDGMQERAQHQCDMLEVASVGVSFVIRDLLAALDKLTLENAYYKQGRELGYQEFKAAADERDALKLQLATNATEIDRLTRACSDYDIVAAQKASLLATLAKRDSELAANATEIAGLRGQLDEIVAALPNYKLNGSNAAAQIRGILSDLESSTIRNRELRGKIAEAKDVLRRVDAAWDAARESRDTAITRCEELSRALAEAEADTERLNWLQRNGKSVRVFDREPHHANSYAAWDWEYRDAAGGAANLRRQLDLAMERGSVNDAARAAAKEKL